MTSRRLVWTVALVLAASCTAPKHHATRHEPITAPTNAAAPPAPSDAFATTTTRITPIHSVVLVDAGPAGVIIEVSDSIPHFPQTTGQATWSRSEYLRTRDGGRSWTALKVPTHDSCYLGETLHAYSSRRLVLARGCDRLVGMDVLTTVDGGAHWTTRKAPYRVGQHGGSALTMSAPTERDIWLSSWDPVAQAETGVGVRTRDGGRSWTTFNLPKPSAVKFFDRDHGFAVDVLGKGSLFMSADGGSSWTEANSYLGVRLDESYFDLPVMTSVGHGTAAVTVTHDDGVEVVFARTDDEGRSWTQTALLPVDAPPRGEYPIQVVPTSIVNDTTWWVAADRRDQNAISVTRDAGATWTTSRPPIRGIVDRIAGLDTREAWISAYDDGHREVWHTADAGTTWRLAM